MFSKKKRSFAVAVFSVLMAITVTLFGISYAKTQKASAAVLSWDIFDGQTQYIKGSKEVEVPIWIPDTRIASDVSVTNASVSGAKFTAKSNISFTKAPKAYNTYGDTTYTYAFWFTEMPSNSSALSMIIPQGYMAKLEIVWASGAEGRQICIAANSVSNTSANGKPVSGCELSEVLNTATVGLYTTNYIAAGTYYIVTNGTSTYIYSIKMTLSKVTDLEVTALIEPAAKTVYVGDTYNFPALLEANVKDDNATVNVAVNWTDSEGNNVTAFTPNEIGEYTFTATSNEYPDLGETKLTVIAEERPIYTDVEYLGIYGKKVYGRLRFMGAGVRKTGTTGIRFGFALMLFNEKGDQITDDYTFKAVAKTIAGTFTIKTSQKNEAKIASYRIEDGEIVMDAVIVNELDAVNNELDRENCKMLITTTIDITAGEATFTLSGSRSIKGVATEALRLGQIDEELAAKYGYGF